MERGRAAPVLAAMDLSTAVGVVDAEVNIAVQRLGGRVKRMLRRLMH
jgi:hypothetical protein